MKVHFLAQAHTHTTQPRARRPNPTLALWASAEIRPSQSVLSENILIGLNNFPHRWTALVRRGFSSFSSHAGNHYRQGGNWNCGRGKARKRVNPLLFEGVCIVIRLRLGCVWVGGNTQGFGRAQESIFRGLFPADNRSLGGIDVLPFVTTADRNTAELRLIIGSAYWSSLNLGVRSDNCSPTRLTFHLICVTACSTKRESIIVIPNKVVTFVPNGPEPFDVRNMNELSLSITHRMKDLRKMKDAL